MDQHPPVVVNRKNYTCMILNQADIQRALSRWIEDHVETMADAKLTFEWDDYKLQVTVRGEASE